MAIKNSHAMRFTPRGLTDAFDATDKFPGACQQLINLVYDQANPELVVSRPGVTLIQNLAGQGFLNPTFISVHITIGTRIYGMVATTRNPGHDEPFVFETASGSNIPVTGVLLANTPVSPATQGDWIPPTMAAIGTMIIVTHPGFPGGGTKFGWFDITNPAAPVWNAGDTATNGLTGVPNAVANFNNRPYFAVGNLLFFADALTNPPTMTNATQVLTVGDPQLINALAGLPVQTTSSGVVQALSVFKQNQVWQVTGDLTSSDLALNYVSLTIGTISPRSVAQSPYGLYFIASGGPYFLDVLGTLRPVTNQFQQIEPDLQTPFQNAITPTRWAGAYNSTMYRVCGKTVIRGRQGTNDYWFDEHKRRWTGPHTFAYDCASNLANGHFVLSSYLNNGLLMQSEPNQSTDSVYTDLGSQVNFTLQTSSFPKVGDMLTKQVAESQIELSASGGVVDYTITAQDDQGRTLETCHILVSFIGTPWGDFVWGDGTLWEASILWGGGAIWGPVPIGSGALWTSAQEIPHTFPVPWPSPLVFEKMQLLITGVASANVGIGTFYARYQKTGYMVTFLQ